MNGFTNARRLLASLVVAAAVTASAATQASAADLKVGDPAPALSFAKFVKGEPVKEIDKDKTYVVEFWATWCGPCKKAIPHVTELQAKHKDVVFIGANVWEDDESLVEPFVTQMGDKMNYRVALDDKSKDAKGAMAVNWLDAAGQNGIPCTFIVNKGTVAWIGHPMQMEKVLDQVTAGTFDADAAKKEAEKANADAEASQAIQAEFAQKVGPLIQNKDFTGAAAAIDEIAAAHPEMADRLTQVKFGLQIQAKQYDDAYATADKIAAKANDNAELLNFLAWTIVDAQGIEKRDYDRAEKYATRANQLEPENAAILDTLARVAAEKGDIAKAISLEEQAIAKADAEMKPELQKTLDGYKAKQAK